MKQSTKKHYSRRKVGQTELEVQEIPPANQNEKIEEGRKKIEKRRCYLWSWALLTVKVVQKI